MLTREEAYNEVTKYVKNKNLVNHMLAVEAIMIGLAEHFDEDTELWGLAGLLHDIDYEETKDDSNLHSLKAAEILTELGLPAEVIQAVKVHNYVHGIPRESLLDKALFAADPVSGLIVAGALVRPDKKLAGVELEYLIRKFGEKAFARGADREQIRTCSEIGLNLEEMLDISLQAMKRISAEIGL